MHSVDRKESHLVRRGDRFRTTRDISTHALIGFKAPAHTGGVDCVVPRDTVLVAVDQTEGASSFPCYPEKYDEMEQVLIPESERAKPMYSSYYLSFPASDIGGSLEPLPPMDPRPSENRLPSTRD